MSKLTQVMGTSTNLVGVHNAPQIQAAFSISQLRPSKCCFVEWPTKGTVGVNTTDDFKYSTQWSSVPGMGPDQAAKTSLLGSTWPSGPLSEHKGMLMHLCIRTNRLLLCWDQSVSILKGLRDFTLKSLSAVKQLSPSLNFGLRNWQFFSCCPGWTKPKSNWTFRENLPQKNSIIRTGEWPVGLIPQQGRLIKDLISGSAAIVLNFLKWAFKNFLFSQFNSTSTIYIRDAKSSVLSNTCL